MIRGSNYYAARFPYPCAHNLSAYLVEQETQGYEVGSIIELHGYEPFYSIDAAAEAWKLYAQKRRVRMGSGILSKRTWKRHMCLDEVPTLRTLIL